MPTFCTWFQRWTDGADPGERAKRVWHGLSMAVHRHAYELLRPGKLSATLDAFGDLAARPVDVASRVSAVARSNGHVSTRE